MDSSKFAPLGDVALAGTVCEIVAKERRRLKLRFWRLLMGFFFPPDMKLPAVISRGSSRQPALPTVRRGGGAGTAGRRGAGGVNVVDLPGC